MIASTTIDLGQAFEYRVKIAVKVLEEDRDWVDRVGLPLWA